MSSTDDRVPAGPEPRQAEGAGQRPDSAAGSAQAAAPDAAGSPAPAAVAPLQDPAASEQTAPASAPPARAQPAGSGHADVPPDGSAAGPRPLGWVIGAVAVVAVAWLVTAVLTYWTSYPILTVTKWEAFTYASQSAKISILVHNSGTTEASGCTVFLQLDRGTVDSYQGPHVLPIPVDGTKWLVIPYRTGTPAPTAPSYAWAQCGRARSPRMRVGTLHEIALLTSNPAVTVGQGGDLVSFQVHNTGTQTATGCRAYVRLTNRKRSFGSSTVQPDVSGGSTRQFVVDLRTPPGFGVPKVAWAYCLVGPHGIITSSRAHFRTSS